MNKSRIEIVQSDITQISVDGIVNAANSRLAGGGGVDGAIHRAAGSELLQDACRKLGGCPTGDVRSTPAFNLSARRLLHTVGPVWQGGGVGEAELLRSCYRNTLTLAEHEGLQVISLPAISCGVYGYPHEAATQIALTTVVEWMHDHALPEKIIFVLFDQTMTKLYQQMYARIVKE